MKAQKLLFLLILSGMMPFIVSGSNRTKSLLRFIVDISLDYCMDTGFPKCIDLCSYRPETSRHCI